MSAPLEWLNVSKTYPLASTPAVDAVSIHINSGETVSLVGESGSGKTTLLRCAAGLETPDSGSIRIGDTTVVSPCEWTPPERRGVGMVFQGGALFPHLTVTRNLAYGLSRLCHSERLRRVADAIDLIGLQGFGDRFPHELSGGERQRVAVARALVREPTAVLLDEPFSNLDPALRRSLRDEIGRILRALKTTAVMVTHDTEDAMAISDRIVILRRGRVAQSGSPAWIYHHPVDEYCARLFGPVNLVRQADGVTRFVRPERMALLTKPEPDAIEVAVQGFRDLGPHWEAIVRPTSAEGDEYWTVHTQLQSIQPGSTLWVREPGIRP